jgi:hypothetical protein
MFGKRKRWQVIVGFALLGMLAAAVVYAYSAFRDYTKPENAFHAVLDIGSVVLCPPTLFFAGCIDCEAVGWSGFVMYSIIGVMNAALYAVVGTIISGWRRRKGESSQ